MSTDTKVERTSEEDDILSPPIGWLTTKEVQAKLKNHIMYVRRLVTQGKFGTDEESVVKIQNRWYINPVKVDAFLEARSARKAQAELVKEEKAALPEESKSKDPTASHGKGAPAFAFARPDVAVPPHPLEVTS